MSRDDRAVLPRGQPRVDVPAVDAPRRLAGTCEWLARQRTVIPLQEAARLLDARGRLPRGKVALTFDDGFASVHEHGWPLLARHRLPATVFLVARTLTPSGQQVDWIDTPPPYETRTLTVDQVLRCSRTGWPSSPTARRTPTSPA